MSKQPNPTDYIELWVEDDGDIILCKRQEPQSGGPAEDISFPTKNLCYGVTELEELAAELTSYGCDKEVIDRTILAVSFENYNEQVTVIGVGGAAKATTPLCRPPYFFTYSRRSK